MFARAGLISLCLVLILGAGWLFSDDLEKPDLASVIRNIQQTLQQLQGEMKDLKSSVKALSRSAKKDKPPRPVQASSGASNAVPAWQRQQEAYDRGRSLEDQKLYVQAIEAYSHAIELDPNSDAAFLRRGTCRYNLGDYAYAISDLTQSLALQPNNSRAYALRASALADSGQAPAALADASEAIRRNSANPDNYILRANLHQRAGEAQPAIDDYTQAIAVAPQSEKAYLGRAAVLRKQGQLAPALKDCYKAIEINPADPAAYLCRAEFYIASGSPQAAIEDINQALLGGENPAQAASLLSAAKQILETKNTAGQASQQQQVGPPAANASATPALPPATGMPSPAALPPSIAPAEPPKVATAAPVQPPAARVRPAIPIARPSPPAASRAVAATRLPAPAPARGGPPKGADYFYREGRRYAASERFAEAMPLYNQAIQLDPKFTLAYNARCYAHLRLHEYNPAIADCSVAIQLNPSYANAYQNRGVARKFAGDRAGAREDFRRVEQFQPVAQAQNSKAGQRQ